LQRGARDRHALVALDCPKQVADSLGIGDRGHVLHEHRFQSATQVGRRIAFGASGRDGISEHLATGLQCTMSRFDRSSRFDAPHGLKQLRCLDLSDWQTAKPGKHILLELLGFAGCARIHALGD
jgi:hypothetical protein